MEKRVQQGFSLTLSEQPAVCLGPTHYIVWPRFHVLHSLSRMSLWLVWRQTALYKAMFLLPQAIPWSAEDHLKEVGSNTRIIIGDLFMNKNSNYFRSIDGYVTYDGYGIQAFALYLKFRNTLRIFFISAALNRQILKHSSKHHQDKLNFH